VAFLFLLQHFFTDTSASNLFIPDKVKPARNMCVSVVKGEYAFPFSSFSFLGFNFRNSDESTTRSQSQTKDFGIGLWFLTAEMTESEPLSSTP
jgi:hypothetical protein